MMKKGFGLAGVFGVTMASILAGSGTYAKAEPNVVVSIKPLHSLVSKVMDGVAVPDLIITGNQSPHNFSLKPSQAAAIQNADAVFWIGHTLESSLEKPIETIGGKGRSVSMMETKGITLFDYREIATIDIGGDGHDHGHNHGGHSHGDHDHGEEVAKKDHDHDHGHSHDDHNHEEEVAKKDHDHDHEHSAKKKVDDHSDHAGHDHDHSGQKDAHIWLDPKNATVMVNAIVDNLSSIDAANAETYKENGAELVAELNALTAEIEPVVSSVKDARYVVFHDAYQYFETNFDMSPVAVITVSPEAQISAARMKELRETVTGKDLSCVFSEPQFNPSIVNTLIDGTPVRTGVLDPLGASLEPGPDLYGQLLRNMATSFQECLAPTG